MGEGLELPIPCVWKREQKHQINNYSFCCTFDLALRSSDLFADRHVGVEESGFRCFQCVSQDTATAAGEDGKFWDSPAAEIVSQDCRAARPGGAQCQLSVR